MLGSTAREMKSVTCVRLSSAPIRGDQVPAPAIKCGMVLYSNSSWNTITMLPPASRSDLNDGLLDSFTNGLDSFTNGVVLAFGRRQAFLPGFRAQDVHGQHNEPRHHGRGSFRMTCAARAMTLAVWSLLC